MSFYDDLLGRLFSGGTELEALGGLNFADGLRAVENESENRIDVSLVPLEDSWLSLGGLELSSAVATTIGSSSTWYDVAGTYATSSLNGGNWTAATSGAGLVWGGAGTAIVLAFASILPTSSSSNTIGFRFSVGGSGAARTEQQIYSSSVGPSLSLIGGFSVAAGATVAIEVCNYTDTDSVTVDGLSLVLLAFGGVTA